MGQRGQRRRRADRGDRPRRRAPRRRGVHRDRDLLRAHDARQPAPLGAGARAAPRGQQLARAHPGHRRRRAPPDRARPPRRRPAAARGAAHPARAGRGGDPRRRAAPRPCGGWARTSTTRSRRCARWRAGSTRPCSPTAASSRPCARPRCSRRCRPPSWPPASAATRARSRRRPTSAAWRRCRTPPSTLPEPAPWSSTPPTTGRCASRCATTAPASIPRRTTESSGFVNMRDRLSAVSGRAGDGLQPRAGDADHHHDPAEPYLSAGGRLTRNG